MTARVSASPTLLIYHIYLNLARKQTNCKLCYQKCYHFPLELLCGFVAKLEVCFQCFRCYLGF